jgi:transposase
MPADVQNRNGGTVLFTTLGERFPVLAKLFADRAYQGPQFAHALAPIRPPPQLKIVTRSAQGKSFVVLPKHWIVKRLLAWLNRCRRLAKDLENRPRYALAFVHLAAICLMVRKLCHSS